MNKLSSLVALFVILLSTGACKSYKKEQTTKKSQALSENMESTQDSKLDQSIKRGEKIYTNLCATCHLPSGKGIMGTYPPLDGSNWLTEKRQESIRGVKYGMQGPIEVNGKEYDNIMTPMGLDNKEVADAMNYVMNSWGNTTEKIVTIEEVASFKEK